MEAVYFSDGRILKDGTSWKYEYNIIDHLGNVRVTFADDNNNGLIAGAEIRSRNDYYAFGMEWNNYLQQGEFNNPKNRYKYNGKEFVEEMGLNHQFYGARNYDPVVGRFTTIDRFSALYAFQNGYSYGAGNPIKYIDVNGDSLKINYKGSDFLYQNGKLYQNGNEYQGKVKGFLKSTVNALNSIRNGNEGASLLSTLENSTNNFTITSSKNNPRGNRSEFKSDSHNKAYANQFRTDPSAANSYSALLNAGVNFSGGSGGTIYWDVNGSLLPTTKGLQNTKYISLAHELFHGLDANLGNLDNRSEVHPLIVRSEWQAMYRENTLRAQLNLPLRTHYITTRDQRGNVIGGSGPLMITPSHSPILPSWYTP